MKHFFFVLVVAVFVVSEISAVRAQDAQMGIAIVVNDDAISVADLNDRMNLIIASSGLPNTDDTRQKLAPQIIGSLVEEQLKLQEAERLDIEVTQGEINNGLSTIAQQNNMELAQFREMLERGGLNVDTMERQARAELAWGKVIQARIRPQITISDNDVDNVVERLEASAGKIEYRVSEILLPIDDPTEEGEVKALADNLVQQIRAEQVPFSRVAQQFSRAPGAPQGGDLGWVQEGQMAPELEEKVASMNAGDVSAPVRTLNGWHILQLRDARVISADNFPSREQIRQSLGMQRLERMQRRHLMDLKSAAFIENRLGS